MSYDYSEDKLVEDPCESILLELGWTVKTAWHNETFATDENSRDNALLGRIDKSEVILKRELLTALKQLNPNLPDIAYQKAITEICQQTAGQLLAVTNQEKYQLFKQGVLVKFQDHKGIEQKKRLKVFDFHTPTENSFLAVRQLEIQGELYSRRPDVIGFVNGIPLVFFELKAPHADLSNAYNENLSDYKDTIPEVLTYNAFIILSNGLDSRVGTVTSPFKFFLEWKRIQEEEEGSVSLETILKGTCDKQRLLDIFENFLLFDGEGDDLSKIMAKNHQYLGVNKVVEHSKNIDDLQGKLGVFWHTQGSGKSYSMVFLCQKMLRRLSGAYTFLIVVDRSELESQIYQTFTRVGAVTEDHVCATSREHLRELLQQNHRYIFTLIHKFSFDPKQKSEYPLLSERKDIIVLSDEAHRSHTETGVFAYNMRFQAIPNASYLGFTGTPIIKGSEEEDLTKKIFGDYVSVYNFQNAIADGATLPLHYLNRGEKLNIENPKLDEEIQKIIQKNDLSDEQEQALLKKLKSSYPILTAEKRLDAIAKDVVWHFNERGYQGKAMFLALDKPTAVKMYDLIQKHWQPFIEDLKQKITQCQDEQQALELKQKLQRVEETEICVVVSPEQDEIKKFNNLELDIKTHREKMVKRDLEKEFKDADNPFRLVIVCAMWITGFDVPCMSTMYLDKPIGGHTLMQTIARANRVYDDEKENGLIVDYGNVYEQLKAAYLIYGDGQGGNGKTTAGGGSGGDKDKPPIEKLEALAVELKGTIENVSQFLQKLNFNLLELSEAKNANIRLVKLGEAKNSVERNNKTVAEFQVLAREVIKKYKALYPEEQIKPFNTAFRAIQAIYKALNPKKTPEDISKVLKELQQEVNQNITLLDDMEAQDEDKIIDLSQLDFEKLKAALKKSKKQNTIVFALQQAVETQLKRMFKQNPQRIELYKKYQQIIKKYNEGKDYQSLWRTFSEVQEIINELGHEQSRAGKEGLTEEQLAIFDLLYKPSLTQEEREKVKEVSKNLLESLQQNLAILRWQKSTQVTAQIKVSIRDGLEYLPEETYPDEELPEKEVIVFQHIYSSYSGDGQSVYMQ